LAIDKDIDVHETLPNMTTLSPRATKRGGCHGRASIDRCDDGDRRGGVRGGHRYVRSAAQAVVPADLTTLVNPLIATQKECNTFPGAALPFADDRRRQLQRPQHVRPGAEPCAGAGHGGVLPRGLPNAVTAELTATQRSGWQLYTFPASTQANVLFNTAEVKGNPGQRHDLLSVHCKQ
jgi:hypothetical protein